MATPKSSSGHVCVLLCYEPVLYTNFFYYIRHIIDAHKNNNNNNNYFFLYYES